LELKKMVKLANPLFYPASVFIGGLFLVVGVRLMRLPNPVVVPGAILIATLTASVLKTQTSPTIELDNPVLSRELQSIRSQAQQLWQQADALKVEATRLLTEAHQLELLGTVEYACDRIRELPTQIDQLALRLQGKDALLSVEDLKKQLQTVETKRRNSTGLAQTQWTNLANSLQRNLTLVQQGQDARQAQLVNLSTLIAEAGGVLQQLQNKLRSANLNQQMVTDELKALSEELSGMQENATLLMS
jgi:chromosome segregation ATPase